MRSSRVTSSGLRDLDMKKRSGRSGWRTVTCPISVHDAFMRQDPVRDHQILKQRVQLGHISLRIQNSPVPLGGKVCGVEGVIEMAVSERTHLHSTGRPFEHSRTGTRAARRYQPCELSD